MKKSGSLYTRIKFLSALFWLYGLLSLPATPLTFAAPTPNLAAPAAQTPAYDPRFGFTVTGNPTPAGLDHELALAGGNMDWYSYDPDQPASTSVPLKLVYKPLAASASATRNRVYQARTGYFYVLAGGESARMAFQSLVNTTPRGSYWLIGNEPNVPGQDSVSPQDYATQYEALKTAIREVDPTAKMVGGNFMNWNTTCQACGGFPRSDSWVPQMMNAYRQQTGHEIDFDVWGFHTYNINWDKLPMVDYGHDINQLMSFRTFLNTLPDQAAKPIWLTEFGIIWGYSGLSYYQDSDHNWHSHPEGAFQTQAALDYLNNYLDWLLANASSQNIGRWFLFTNFGIPDAYTDSYPGINLFEDVSTAGHLTPSGELYRDKSLTTPLVAPSGLTLQAQPTSDSQNNIKLSWTDNTSSESGFYVERRAGTAGNFTRIATLAANATSYQDFGLNSAGMYYYRVQAFDGSYRSHYSVEAAVLPSLGTLQVTSVAAGQVNLSWANPLAYTSSAVNFVVEARVGLNGAWTQLATLPPGSTTYSQTSPPADTLYFYRVRAYNNAVGSPYTNVVSAVTPGPAELTVTSNGDNGQIHSLSYALDWASTHSPKTVILALPANQTTLMYQGNLPAFPAGVTIAGSCGSGGANYTLDFSGASNKAAGLSISSGTTLYGVALKGTRLIANSSRNWLGCVSLAP